MNSERELYQQHYKTSRDYKFYANHEMTENQIFEFNNGKYSVDCVNDGWKIWQASANREGYKLVPVVANKKMLKAGYDAHNDFFFDGQVQDVYKAMIGAVDE